MSSQMFNGDIALVTGGGGGMGRATSQILEREGAKVIVADINFNRAKETVNTLKDPSQHLAVEMNVTTKTSVLAGISKVLDKYKAPPTLVVNGAGVVKFVPFLSVDLDQDTDMMEVNMKGTALVSQVTVKAMMEHGTKSGSIVNISSIIGKVGHPDVFQYSASKGAVTSFTKSIARDLASKGIRVNCVLPGIIDTEMMHIIPPEIVEFSTKHLTPLGRLGKPEEVAEVIAFLLSDRSSFMVGACVEITGGAHM